MTKELDPVATAQVEAWEANFKQTEEGQRPPKPTIKKECPEWHCDDCWPHSCTC